MVLMLLACAGGRVGAPPPETVWDPENRNTVQMEVIEAYIDSGNCDRALYGISSVRDDGLADPNLDFLQASALLCKGLPGDAVKLLEGQYVRSPERNRLMCLAHMDMGQVDDAVQACGAALKHTPKNTDSERRADWRTAASASPSASLHRIVERAVDNRVAERASERTLQVR